MRAQLPPAETPDEHAAAASASAAAAAASPAAPPGCVRTASAGGKGGEDHALKLSSDMEIGSVNLCEVCAWGSAR